MKLKCNHCDYEWDYGGTQKFYATCPQCRYKVPVRKVDEEKENDNIA